MIAFIYAIHKYSKLVNVATKKYRYREQISGYQWGEEREEGQYRGRDINY